MKIVAAGVIVAVLLVVFYAGRHKKPAEPPTIPDAPGAPAGLQKVKKPVSGGSLNVAQSFGDSHRRPRPTNVMR